MLELFIYLLMFIFLVYIDLSLTLRASDMSATLGSGHRLVCCNLNASRLQVCPVVFVIIITIIIKHVQLTL